MRSDEVYGGHALGGDSVLATVKSASGACTVRVLPIELWPSVSIFQKDQVDGGKSADAVARSAPPRRALPAGRGAPLSSNRSKHGSAKARRVCRHEVTAAAVADGTFTASVEAGGLGLSREEFRPSGILAEEAATAEYWEELQVARRHGDVSLSEAVQL